MSLAARGAAGVILSGVLAPLLAGCATLEADRELGRAERNVEVRLGVRPDWLGAAALSEPSGDLWTMTDRDAVVLALSHDADLLAMVERVREARADLVQEGLLPNPVLSVELAWPVSDGGGTKVAVGLTQQLVALLTRRDRMRAADDELAASVLELSERAIEIAAKARATHTHLRHARARLGPARRSLELARSALEVARTQRLAGQATSMQIVQQEVALLAAQASLEDHEAHARTHERELLSVVGSPQYLGGVEAAAPVLDSADVPDDEAVILAMALEQRLDVAAQDARARAALTRAGVAASEAFSDLAAGPAFERTDDGRKELGPAISVPIPIFDTGDARKAKGVAVARQAELHAVATRRRAVAEVRSSWAALRLASARLSRAEGAARSLAAEGVRLADAAVQSGEADRLALIGSQIAAEQVNVQIIDAQEQAELARIALWRAVGGMLATRPGRDADR